ncbi:MAG: response regulator transcription factor [Acidimicrobiaceae bacterium]|nr:response regulator transcription factor [Acidimicrobiaceae bacterium]MYA75313.1 response regulator transcription factor [Acidimicrobiaceae bacterium]MYG54598.1 response regulator transcription factor [Acidimicrobiaceae bacterium]MYJ98148.1 response regulator transcription factor [Acidimicrobiaceae bacterium]
MRVLIVEDEVRLAASVARGLQADGIYADLAHDGRDGLWRAREGNLDAIVLDIMLPGMNGYDMCRTLRAEEIWTPILLLTAKGGEFDEVEGLELGADDYLRKPFSHAVLSARLRALARRGKSPRPTSLEVGDLELDPGTRHCSRRGKKITLTPREYSVLEVLMRRSPEVLTKDEILLSAWGMDFEGDPNIVEVYIGYLRRKIDKPFAVNSVRTVRGAGYQVVA